MERHLERLGGVVSRYPWIREFTGELIGTFLLCFLGLAAVAAATYSSSMQGLWQVASVWGFGVTIAIYTTGTVSGAHLNPAVSLAFALVRPSDFRWQKLLHYIPAQLLGAMLAGGVLYGTWAPLIDEFELKHNITRGTSTSTRSACSFGEYFPDPGLAPPVPLITPLRAAITEATGTALLALVIFSFTDKKNKAFHCSSAIQALTPLFIGFTVAILICAFAPITQAGFNPARDLGPRIVAAAAGWRSVALPGPHNGFWVYIIGPLIGGPIGAFLYELLVGIHYYANSQPCVSCASELCIPMTACGTAAQT